MKRTLRTSILALGLLLVALTAQASTGGPYDLSWWTVDGGGFTFSTGGDYSVGGTAGQPDAGIHTGGDFTVIGGFWGVAGASPTTTPTEGPSPTPSRTPTEGPSPTASRTPTEGPSPTPTETGTPGPSPTATATGQPPGLQLYLPAVRRD